MTPKINHVMILFQFCSSRAQSSLDFSSANVFSLGYRTCDNRSGVNCIAKIACCNASVVLGHVCRVST